jgi:hypothetical protein
MLEAFNNALRKSRWRSTTVGNVEQESSWCRTSTVLVQVCENVKKANICKRCDKYASYNHEGERRRTLLCIKLPGMIEVKVWLRTDQTNMPSSRMYETSTYSVFEGSLSTSYCVVSSPRQFIECHYEQKKSLVSKPDCCSGCNVWITAINVRFHIVPATVSKPNKTINENVGTNAQVSQRMAPRTSRQCREYHRRRNHGRPFSRVL